MAISQIQNASLASGVPSSIASSALPAGTVLQVVQANSSNPDSTTSTNFVTSSVSLTITPKSANSKIFAIASARTYQGTSNTAQITVYRNSTTNLIQTPNYGLYISASGGIYGFQTVQGWDTPNTTSSTTYSIFFKSNNGGTVSLDSGGAAAYLTIMEIAG